MVRLLGHTHIYTYRHQNRRPSHCDVTITLHNLCVWVVERERERENEKWPNASLLSSLFLFIHSLQASKLLPPSPWPSFFSRSPLTLCFVCVWVSECECDDRRMEAEGALPIPAYTLHGMEHNRIETVSVGRKWGNVHHFFPSFSLYQVRMKRIGNIEKEREVVILPYQLLPMFLCPSHVLSWVLPQVTLHLPQLPALFHTAPSTHCLLTQRRGGEESLLEI